ncbi:MAG: NAD(P)H-dependent glycerol-3-phosphate dehydrogenase [Chloroflexota bacterium]
MITVVGTGSWGTTLAVALTGEGVDTTLLARSPEEAAALASAGENVRFLPGVAFPSALKVSGNPAAALAERQLILLVVPAQRMRENLRALSGYIPESALLVSAAKGLELGSCKRMSEVIVEELGGSAASRVAALSGPNLACEVAAGLPTATVVAAADEQTAVLAQSALRLPRVRVYTNTDLIGVELAGALKNIIALGAGICDGLGYGDNAKAAFLTRGLAEIARLGVAMGANPLTFAGLAGVGDLVATCASRLSRNRYVGEQLGQGKSLTEIEAGMSQVAEGVTTTAAARALAQRYRVEMPITEKMYEVLFAGGTPREGVVELMMRDQKGELAGMMPPEGVKGE